MPNFLGWSNKRLESYFNALYNGDFNAKNLPPELYNAILAKLTDAIARGFGPVGTSATRAKVATGLVDNISVFSAAKTFHQVNDTANFLFDAKGNKNTFSKFRKAAAQIFDTYNNNWLKTEFNTAVGQSQSASNWVQYQDQADALPYLKYQTAADERVRHQHVDLDGVIKPVNSPFWDTYAPLNGFNCRCSLIQLDDGKATETGDLEKPHPLFSHNPAKSRVIFDETAHPYFTVDKRYKIAPRKGVKTVQPPRAPKVTKKPQPAKVVPLVPGSPQAFKTKKAAGEYLAQTVESTTDLKTSTFRVSSKLSLPALTRAVNTAADLFKEYRLASATGASERTKLSFSSTKKYYGWVKSGQDRRNGSRVIAEINLGHETDLGGSRLFVKGATKDRFKSRVDPENIDIATTTHEFAHVISVERVKRMGKASENDRNFLRNLGTVKNDYLAALRAAETPQARNEIHLGEYALTNLNEFMAEGFTEYKLSSNPSKYAVEIGKLIDKHYKR